MGIGFYVLETLKLVCLILIWALLMIAVSSDVKAYSNATCTTYGNVTRCWGTDENGNYGSTTCTTYGNVTRCTRS